MDKLFFSGRFHDKFQTDSSPQQQLQNSEAFSTKSTRSRIVAESLHETSQASAEIRVRRRGIHPDEFVYFSGPEKRQIHPPIVGELRSDSHQ
jgi:hypothetical protein